jgi:hypothetical protein
MPTNKKVTEEVYVEPTVEVSGELVDPLSPSASVDDSSVTICGCCLC